MDRIQVITSIIKNYEEQISVLKKELDGNKAALIIKIDSQRLTYHYENASAYSGCTFSGFYINDNRSGLFDILFANKTTGAVYDYIYGPEKCHMKTSYELCRIITYMYFMVTDMTEKERLIEIYTKIVSKNEVFLRFRDNDELSIEDLEELLTILGTGYALDKMIGTVEALKYVVSIGSSIAATKVIRKARMEEFCKTKYRCLVDITYVP